MMKIFLAALLAAVVPSGRAQSNAPRSGLAPLPSFVVAPSTPTFRTAATFAGPAPSAGLPAGLQSSVVGSPAALDRLFDGGAKKGGDWEFRLAFGPTRNSYFDTDITVHSSKIDGTFKKAQLSERHGMENYQFWDKSKTGNPFKWMDEPTNRLVATAENKKRRYALSLVLTHPKVLVVDKDKVNQDVAFQGTIEGRPVDGKIRINDYFSQWHMTYGMVDYAARFEKTIPLWRGKRGALDYAPGLGAGFMTSSCAVSYRVPGTEWDSVSYDQGIKFIGYSGSLSNRLTYTLPNGRFNASVSHDLTVSRARYPFMDGWAEQNLNYQTLWFGLGARLYKTKKPSNP